MSKQSRDRHQTVAELGNELERFLRGTSTLPQKKWPKGAHIVDEGDEGETAFVVVSGTLEVYITKKGERKVLRTLGPGDVFGEMAVFTAHARSATVEAMSEVQLIEVTKAALSDGLGLNSWMGAFVTALAERFHEADQQLREDR